MECVNSVGAFECVCQVRKMCKHLFKINFRKE